MQQIVWQAWDDGEGGVLFAPRIRCQQLKRQGLFNERFTLLHEILASTGEEAMTFHFQRMGFEPYKPSGEPKPCPNQCGGYYYPEGYGDCPNCGHIG